MCVFVLLLSHAAFALVYFWYWLKLSNISAFWSVIIPNQQPNSYTHTRTRTHWLKNSNFLSKNLLSSLSLALIWTIYTFLLRHSNQQWVRLMGATILCHSNLFTTISEQTTFFVFNFILLPNWNSTCCISIDWLLLSEWIFHDVMRTSCYNAIHFQTPKQKNTRSVSLSIHDWLMRHI